MLMYLELSRPKGDVSRWEKVLKRITLLNKNYPLKSKKCQTMDFQRSFEDTTEEEKEIYKIVRDSFIDQGVVFFGGYANSLYANYLPKRDRKFLSESPDFDVLSMEPEKTAEILKERLRDEGYKHIKIIKKPGVGELLSVHYEIKIDKETVAFIYEPIAVSYTHLTLPTKA